MTIWVDADACPVAIKEILFRAANRSETDCCLIANQYIPVPKSKFLSSVQVSHGFDVADNEIVQRCVEGDLVITSDIPLAAEVIEKGAKALSPRGEPYSKANIGARLNMRDFMDTMRASGIQSGGPPPLGPKEKQAFANQLDKYLAKLKK
ncbi:YaiI/YqxD family protein [uncultured Pseudoteredinibacter sp.]|uniref:YaiI/YqxD family protein n=1 Tax=uncultured Pseudoteredinibacter sp. TaxID=1641701 RepID=UPI002610B34F|nr:YaiI/YqxD family protein [uncultured Pseudoteredinibacter sp.]